MRLPNPQQRGFALPLALTTSALLLLSSLSLQTLALHARQRSSQALATAQTRDAERSVAMAFQQLAAGAHACLLALPFAEWESSERCPGVNPALLQSGRVADRYWQLLDWQPKGTRAGTLQLPLQAAQQLLSPAVTGRHGFILPRFGRQCICLRPTCL